MNKFKLIEKKKKKKKGKTKQKKEQSSIDIQPFHSKQ